jgi:anti-sigma factor RsiW
VADEHGSHDLEAMVAYADGQLAGAELEAATSQVRSCPDCAALVADLRALAIADRELATPVRPRDFRLTPADAVRLGRPGPEPHVIATRLGRDMTDTPTIHAAHDPELIAAAVDRTLDGPDRLKADAWLASCATCAELHADLLAIVSAERALPTPSRTRDFQLTPADAHRLRPRGLRAVLAAIGSSRDAFSKPLAVGLTTLGLAGLLVGTVPSSGLGGATSATLSTVGSSINAYSGAKNGESSGISETNGDGTVFGGQDGTPSAAASAAAASAAPGAAAPAPSAAASAAASAAPQPVTDVGGPIVQSAVPREAAGSSPARTATGDTTALEAGGATDEAARLVGEGQGPSVLLIASIAMLAVGLGLFAARWGARRLRAT